MNHKVSGVVVFLVSSFASFVWLPSAALANRTGNITITVDGRVYLHGQYSEIGSSPPAAVWWYCSTTQLQPQEGVQITPDPADPLRAILRGKIVLDVENGDKAEVKELRLVRNDAQSATWTVDPADVERIAIELGLSGEPAGVAETTPTPGNRLAANVAPDSFPWQWVAGGAGAAVLIGAGLIMIRRRINPQG
jgi:hypothetical protein